LNPGNDGVEDARVGRSGGGSVTTDRGFDGLHRRRDRRNQLLPLRRCELGDGDELVVELDRGLFKIGAQPNRRAGVDGVDVFCSNPANCFGLVGSAPK
jgi:hypothetical protein